MKKITNPWRGMPGYRCFGCDPNSATGLRMSFYEHGNEVLSLWRPRAEFQGWIDTLHGGIQATLADEIGSWVIFRHYQSGVVTSRMEVRYLHPVRTTDSYLLLRAEEKQKRRNFVDVAVKIYDASGKICTEALCIYCVFPPEKSVGEYCFLPCEVEDVLPEDDMIKACQTCGIEL